MDGLQHLQFLEPLQARRGSSSERTWRISWEMRLPGMLLKRPDFTAACTREMVCLPNIKP
jgi:hypothetical protein